MTAARDGTGPPRGGGLARVLVVLLLLVGSLALLVSLWSAGP
jgi:hypothetical protein